MSFARERQAREELAAIRTSLKPIHDKLQRGERLSVTESRKASDLTDKAFVLQDELQSFAEARALSTEGASAMGGVLEDSQESRAFSRYITTGETTPELRAASVGTNSAGGFLVPPGWWQKLQVALKAYGGVAADFEPLETETGQPMQWATTDPTAISGVLIAENTQISDQDYTFGQGTIGAYMITSQVQKASFQLAQDQAFNLDVFVQARVGEALGRALATYAISGTGSSQPLGIITALAAKSSTGTVGATETIAPTGGFLTLGTAQKVRTLSATPATAGEDTLVTEVGGNILAPSSVLALIRSVDPAYRDLGAKFYMNDAQLQGMRAIVDAFGRPFYESLQGANPTLHDYPVTVDQQIPNITASTTGGPVFGHLPSAMVKRTVAGGASIMRLQERYADFLQVGFIGYMRMDSRSNDLRAAATVKAAAS